MQRSDSQSSFTSVSSFSASSSEETEEITRSNTFEYKHEDSEINELPEKFKLNVTSFQSQQVQPDQHANAEVKQTS